MKAKESIMGINCNFIQGIFRNMYYKCTNFKVIVTWQKKILKKGINDDPIV